jgi:ATP-dependent DNA helicase RecG
MTKAEFAAAFPHEGRYVEFKAGVNSRPIQRAITAFSNTDGGVLLLGVADDGTVLGKTLTPGVEDTITQAILSVHDPGRYRIVELNVEGNPVTVITVARRNQGFAQTPEGLVLVRRGANSVPLVGAELLQFVTERSLMRFEATDARVSLSDADAALLEQVRSAFGWSDGELTDRLRNEGLLVGDGQPHLTIAGALLLLPNPSEALGKAYVEVLRYPDEGVNYDRRVLFEGPVQRLVSEATEFVMDELGTDLVVSGAQRIELPKVPAVAVREAIANAVAHRSYEELGRGVRVELRPDRLVIESPGGLPEPVTEENIRETQAARNIKVIKVLRLLALAEDSGRGVDVMIDSMAEALLDPPEFHDLGHSVRVTLPIRGPITPQERAWVKEVERRGELQPYDRILLIHAARGEQLSNERARELLGVDSRDARQALGRLRDGGFLTQVGERGGARYVLSSTFSAPVIFRLSPRQLQDLVVSLAEERPVTNALVRQETGLDRVAALRLLDRLVEEGRLVRRGERRGTEYVLAR